MVVGTPLYAAAMNGHIACVEVLLNYRANAFKFKNGGAFLIKKKIFFLALR